MRFETLQELYSREEYYWGTDPNEFAHRTLTYLPNNLEAHTLDIGAGEGRDAVFFAEQGHTVHAIDIAPNGLNKAEALATKRGVRLFTAVADINSFQPPRTYDLVYSIGTLQYLKPENRERQFSRLKERTAPGGVHAMFTFIDHPKVATAPDWTSNEHLYESDELSPYYDGWTQMYERAYVFDDDSGGVPHQHAAQELIVKKP